MNRAVTLPGSWASVLVELLTEKGFSPQQIFADSGLDENTLHEENPQVSYRQLHRLEENALMLTGDRGLGLELGARARISHFGMLGYAIASAENIVQAMALGSRYFGLFNSVVDFRYNLDTEEPSAEAYSRVPLGSMERFTFEMVISCLFAIGRFLLEKPAASVHVSFTFAEPPHSDLYQRYFRCPIQFDAPSNAIFFDREYLTQPLKLADSEVAAVCKQQCERWLQDTNPEDEFIAMVREEILRVPGKFPNIATVSTVLHISPRTLSRRLAERGASYQQMLDDVRRDVAIDYLRDTQFSVEQIAQLLDFSDSANFRKAFKKWTGRVPNDYRAR